MTAPLLEVRGLSRDFDISAGLFAPPRKLRAAHDVSFILAPGEILGIVGESGSGKTTVGRLLMRLTEPSAGSVQLGGGEITRLSGPDLLPFRRRMQMIFQDPNSSLNPRIPVGEQIAEGMVIHGIGSAGDQRARVAELIDRVGLPADSAHRFAHEFSGGQRQRIGIARALAVGPEILIADESVSALDVSVQAQILNMLLDLRDELGLAIIFISHDLSVVEFFSDRVMVMYLGQVVEIAPAADLFRAPRHPYTAALLDASPLPDPARRQARRLIEGDLPSPIDLPPGCVFQKRCPKASDACRAPGIALRAIGEDRATACIKEWPGAG